MEAEMLNLARERSNFDRLHKPEPSPKCKLPSLILKLGSSCMMVGLHLPATLHPPPGSSHRTSGTWDGTVVMHRFCYHTRNK